MDPLCLSVNGDAMAARPPLRGSLAKGSFLIFFEHRKGAQRSDSNSSQPHRVTFANA